MTALPALTQSDFEIKGLSVSYPLKAGAVQAVSAVNLSLRAGEALGIVGESGSGKSTLALAIAGLLDNGEASVSADVLRCGETDLRRMPEAVRTATLGRRIGFVFQNPHTALNPVMKIGRQMTDHLRWHLGVSRSEAHSRAASLLGEVGIGDPERRMSSYPYEFSGGMLQRVTIAMALACDPQWLIADEPTTALDASVQADVVDLVNGLRRKRNLGLVWVTHDLALLRRIADRIAVMYAGQLVEIGPAEQIFEAPSHPYTQALLASVHSMWETDDSRFRTIEGSPPDLSRRDDQCPFRPRCPEAFARCAQRPEPIDTISAHAAACWLVPEPQDVA